jgi:hypothetical protein
MASPAVGFRSTPSAVIQFEAAQGHALIATLTFDVTPTPPFLYILRLDLRSATMVKLSGQGMESNPLMPLNAATNLILISVLNNGWQLTGPFAGQRRFSAFYSETTTGGRNSRLFTIPTDGLLEISARNQTDAGSFQLFTYTPYLSAPENI